jgi:hypothetical protein
MENSKFKKSLRRLVANKMTEIVEIVKTILVCMKNIVGLLEPNMLWIE